MPEPKNFKCQNKGLRFTNQAFDRYVTAGALSNRNLAGAAHMRSRSDQHFVRQIRFVQAEVDQLKINAETVSFVLITTFERRDEKS
ncbi:hypothetical protein TNIN_284711 [Trichonephila inaurata madagascariensis]|uniref:Uncharacterized protein n=1 Tax=Trichonephila inaurata madagascariensis TaxID=2747483 RepID=A0A8X6X6J3_9ARAC|nr:hypothetical protein TNIN_284711 [Trichonephila inaurata madagascariensis]